MVTIKNFIATIGEPRLLLETLRYLSSIMKEGSNEFDQNFSQRIDLFKFQMWWHLGVNWIPISIFFFCVGCQNSHSILRRWYQAIRSFRLKAWLGVAMVAHWGEFRSELRFKCFSSSNPESHFLWFDTAFVVILVWIMTFSSIKTTICPPRTPWIVIIGFFTLIGKTSKTRGKSLLELWILDTTFLPDWQQPLIFVRFISNFLCMDSNSMGSAHVILK